MNGPRKGWRRRTDPVYTMLDTGTDAAPGNQKFPRGLGGADDGRHDYRLTAAPLPITGAAGSPVNPIAVK